MGALIGGESRTSAVQYISRQYCLFLPFLTARSCACYSTKCTYWQLDLRPRNLAGCCMKYPTASWSTCTWLSSLLLRIRSQEWALRLAASLLDALSFHGSETRHCLQIFIWWESILAIVTFFMTEPVQDNTKYDILDSKSSCRSAGLWIPKIALKTILMWIIASILLILQQTTLSGINST